MKIDDYLEIWEEDSKIDPSDLTEESLKAIPLHSKYMNYLYPENVKLEKLLVKKKKLETTLEGYYGGSIDGKDIGRPPNPIIYKTDAVIKRKVESDDEIIKWNLAIIEQQSKVELLRDIIKLINNRSFSIRNHIDYMKFMNGVGG